MSSDGYKRELPIEIHLLLDDVCCEMDAEDICVQMHRSTVDVVVAVNAGWYEEC